MQNERIAADDFYGLENDQTGAEEGSDEFHSARSGFSIDKSNGAGNSPTESDAEPPRILSDVENAILNARIDHLVHVLTSGRTVCFDQDPVTGKVDITVGQSGHTSEEAESDDPEAQVAAFPENFGNIISSRRQMNRSPASILYSWSTTDSQPEVQGESLFGRAASASFSSDNEFGSPLEKSADIRRAVRQLEEEAGDPRGSRLARMGSEDVEIVRVFPVPLDFDKAPQATTPSIDSEGSGLDRSSPLFMKSYRRRVQDANGRSLQSSSDVSGIRAVTPDRVFAWLEKIEASRKADNSVEPEGKGKAFGILKDTPIRSIDPGHAEPAPVVLKVLKDVSNLRQPGYRQKNIFALDKNQEVVTKPSSSPKLPSLSLGGALDEESRRTYIDLKCPRQLESRGESSDREASRTRQEAIAQRLETSTKYNQGPSTGHDVPTTEHSHHPDPERAAHFELALARLEGRAAPPESSPIRRLVNPHSMYGSDVEVEIRRLRPRQPIAIRYQTDGHTVAEQFENVLQEDRQRRHNA